MSIARDAVIAFLNEILGIDKIRDLSVNGLQIEGNPQVDKVALCVDACMEAYQQAVDQGCDMLIAHHGIIWGGIKAVRGTVRKQMKYLLDNNLNLYAAHLPLDMHPEYGNNIRIARDLALNDVEPFGTYEGAVIGFKGGLSGTIAAGDLAERLADLYGGNPVLLGDEQAAITTVGIVSGGGAGELQEAIDEDIDCFITGESAHWNYHAAREADINVIYAGHYHTEKPGVQAVGALLEKEFELETVFLDIPTPI